MPHYADLNDRDQEVLNFITAYQRKNGRPPSRQEIADHLKVKSTSLVRYYLGKLERAGKLQVESGARGIRLMECEGEIVVIRDGYMGICWTCRKVCRTVTRELANDWIENHKKKGKVK